MLKNNITVFWFFLIITSSFSTPHAVVKCLRWTCAGNPIAASQCVAEKKIHNKCAERAYDQIQAFKKLNPDSIEAYQQKLFHNKFFAFLSALSPQMLEKMATAFAKEKNKQPLTTEERKFLLHLVAQMPVGHTWVMIQGKELATLSTDNVYFLAHQQKINFANISFKRLTKALRETKVLTDLKVSFFKGTEGSWFKQDQFNLKKLQNALKECTHLRTMEIDAQNLDMTRLQGILETVIAANPGLQSLVIANVKIDRVEESELLAKTLMPLKHLQHVGLRFIEGHFAPSFFLKAAALLRKVPSLDLTGCNLGNRVTTVPVLKALSEVGRNYSSVRKLNVSHINLSRDALLAIRGFHLTHLTMATNPAPDERDTLDVQALKKLLKSLPSLQGLSLSGYYLRPDLVHLKEVIDMIAQYKSLSDLTLSYMHVGDQEIQPLAQRKSLTNLDLEGNDIGRIGVRDVIVKLPRLEKLNLTQNKGLGRLGVLELRNREALPHLKWLSFSEVGLSSQALKELRREKNVKGESIAQVTVVVVPQGEK